MAPRRGGPLLILAASALGLLVMASGGAAFVSGFSAARAQRVPRDGSAPSARGAIAAPTVGPYAGHAPGRAAGLAPLLGASFLLALASTRRAPSGRRPQPRGVRLAAFRSEIAPAQQLLATTSPLASAWKPQAPLPRPSFASSAAPSPATHGEPTLGATLAGAAAPESTRCWRQVCSQRANSACLLDFLLSLFAMAMGPPQSFNGAGNPYGTMAGPGYGTSASMPPQTMNPSMSIPQTMQPSMTMQSMSGPPLSGQQYYGPPQSMPPQSMPYQGMPPQSMPPQSMSFGQAAPPPISLNGQYMPNISRPQMVGAANPPVVANNMQYGPSYKMQYQKRSTADKTAVKYTGFLPLEGVYEEDTCRIG